MVSRNSTFPPGLAGSGDYRNGRPCTAFGPVLPTLGTLAENGNIFNSFQRGAAAHNFFAARDH
jgi:hypothetical protein